MKAYWHITALGLFSAVLSACKPGVPKEILSEGKMEEVLYDYHVAQGLIELAPTDSSSYYARVYTQAVFAKYGIDRDEFDRSMEWYERHTDKLEAVYKRVAERLGDVGANRSFASAADGALSGDTLNIWHASSTAMLHSQGRNYYCFSQKADTTVHSRDRLEWNFTPAWFYHEGERQAQAVLVIHYENDSTDVRRSSIRGSGRHTLSVVLSDRKVTGIEGFVYQASGKSRKPRILQLSNFSLLRIRPKQTEQTNEEAEKKDSARLSARPAELRIRDSLLRADTLERKRPHFRE